MDISGLSYIVGIIIYGLLAIIAFWGAYQAMQVWRRVKQQQFRSEKAQDEFLAILEDALNKRDFNAIGEICERDPRALSQLVLLAIVNRKTGYAKIRQLVLDRFQRDILSEFEHRLSWVNTVIKSAPMIGLLGTVIGMIGAFGELAAPKGVKSDQSAETEQSGDVSTRLAGNISIALNTTACGLAIAIPLVLCLASINMRIRNLEDLVASGLTRFLENYKAAVGPG